MNALPGVAGEDGKGRLELEQASDDAEIDRSPVDDAKAAAEAHLREQQAAEQFPAPVVESPRKYAQAPAPVQSYQVAAPQLATRQRETTRSPIKVVEEIYARYPISQGYRVRVWRKEPKRDAYGMLATGWLGDIEEPVSMGDFTSRYGGGKYSLLVIGPNDPMRGDVTERAIAEMSLEIPGAPRMILPPQLAEQEDMMTQGIRYALPQQVVGESEKVAVTKMQLEDKHRERLEEREQAIASMERENLRAMLQAAKPSDASLQAIQEQGSQAMKHLTEQYDNQVQMLRDQQLEQQKLLHQKDEELRQLRTDILAARQEAVTAINNAETRAVQELRERHRTEVDAMREQSRKEVEDLRHRYDEEMRKSQADYIARLAADSSKYQGELSTLTQKSDRDRDRLEDQWQKERASMREDFRLKEDMVRASYEDRLRQQKDMFEARISDLSRDTQRQIESAKANQDLALSTIRETHESRAKVENKASELRIQSLESDLARSNSRLESLQRDNDRMMAEMHKPLPRALKEIEENARVIGMIKPDEIEPQAATTTEGKTDWGQVAMRVAQGLAEKAPEMLQKLSETRQNNAAAAAKAAPVVAARQLPAAQAGIPSMAPAAMRQRKRMPPAPGTALGAPHPAGGPPPVVAAPMYVQRSVVPETHISQGPAAPPSSGAAGPMPPEQVPYGAPGYTPPLEAGWDAAAGSVAASPVPTQAAAPGPQPSSAPVTSVVRQVETPQITEAQVQMFVAQLEQSIAQGVEPAHFAAALINQMGAENAALALGQVDPGKIVELVANSQAGAQSPIVTRAGERYVHEVWEAARQQLRAKGAQV